VTAYLFIIQKEKENQNQKKRNIKSRKIDKRKRKRLVLMHIITVYKLKPRLFRKVCNTVALCMGFYT